MRTSHSFRTVWEEGQKRLANVNHLVDRTLAVLELPDDAADLPTLSRLPPEFLELEFRHMTAGFTELRELERRTEEASQQQQQRSDPSYSQFVAKSSASGGGISGDFSPAVNFADQQILGAEDSDAAVKRRERWQPCFHLLDDVESNLLSLELELRKGIGSENRPYEPRVSATDKADALTDGLNTELVELSSFLKMWLGDLAVRTKYLLVMEMTRKNLSFQNCTEASTQTMEQFTQPPKRISAGPQDRHTVTSKDGDTDQPLQSETETETEVWKSKGSQGYSSATSSNSAFNRVARRTVAALQLQRLYRGHLTRRVTGNWRLRTRTFFHARDSRIVSTFCRRMVFQSQPTANPMWLLGLTGNLLVGKAMLDSMTSGWIPFSEFCFQYFADAFPNEETELSMARFLSGLTHFASGDFSLTLMIHLLVGDLTRAQELSVSQATRKLSEVLLKAQTFGQGGNPGRGEGRTHLTLDLETEHYLTPHVLDQLLKSIADSVPLQRSKDVFLTVLQEFLKGAAGREGLDSTNTLPRPLTDMYRLKEFPSQSERRVSHKQFLLCLPILLYILGVAV